MHLLYLGSLLLSCAGMAVLDYRYALAFWCNARRTAKVLIIGLAAFTIWDILGVSFGIFFSGNSPYMTGIYLMPEFPLEELFFLIFLCYFTLIMQLLLEKQWRRI